MLTSLRSRLRRLFRKKEVSEPPPVTSRPAVAREAVEALAGMPVSDLALFEQALKHRSVLRGTPKSHLYSNERLEFLGDAVLGFVVAEHLYRHFPDRTEGFLTRLRSKLVNGEALARCAEGIDLGPLILMSDNMVQAGGQHNATILADAFEAVIGALFLDSGIEVARRFIHRTMLDQVDLDALSTQRDNYKSLLLEHAQAEGWAQPEYRVVEEEGPSHDRRFTVEVLVRGTSYGSGRARSKKSAEQKAAREALERLDEEDESMIDE